MPNHNPTASPVFVDPTGRRRRTIRTAAIVGAGSLLSVGALLLAALLGAPIGPSTFLPQPLPEPAAEHGAQLPPATLSGDQPAPDEPDAEPASADAPDSPSLTSAPVPGSLTTTTTHGRATNSPQGKPTDLPAPAPPGQTR
jgi:hypothetical protein